MADPVFYAQLNLTDARPPLRETTPHPKGHFSRIKKSLFGLLLVICVIMGTIIVYICIQASSLQCSHNMFIAENLPGNETNRPPTSVTITGLPKASLSDVCSEGWLLLNQKCYFFSEERRSQAESHQSCTSLEAKLATIKPTQTILKGFIWSLGGDYWVGLKKERRDRYWEDLWYWSDGAIEENLLSDDDSKSCAKIGKKSSTEPKPEPCSTELRWICEKPAAMPDTL
ncbi:early activation antigen CD69-like [Hyla sarda]|uniref:early activation antigen CD69-like n=1 Tax=Hyla sarda TaxID=327740 RepID=UPI0024C2EDC2|nr:early activation antigen CD69-like [Hyla sarda]